MLLVFVGPLISQSQRLLMQDPDGRVMSGAEAHALAAHDEMTHRSDALAACGYCLLFAHTPGLAPSLAPSAMAPPPTWAGALGAPPAPLAAAPYPHFSPRAPPRALMS